LVKEKEYDDLTAFKLTGSSCAGQTTCTATLVNEHPGFANTQVAFLPATSTQIMQAESAPVLWQALALLKKRGSLQVEVQGYTDDVGTDAYNQTLSDSRAAAVVAWLTQHGIAAKRLTSKGYGKAKPVTDNGNDEGRAMNRRIEIADTRCVPKGD
jgi:outer membrane protein OmpA-like peptidoglycan-associated protein